MATMDRNDSDIKERHGAEPLDPLQLYLHDIGRLRLEPKTEEEKRQYDQHLLDLARQVKAAREDGRNLGNVPAYQELIEANLKLVVTIAKRHGTTAALLDRINEGNIGLMKAIAKFDPDKGFRLSTYATWWIEQAIFEAQHQTRFVDLPAHIEDRQRTVKKAYDRFIQENGCEPTTSDLVEYVLVILNERCLRRNIKHFTKAEGRKPTPDELHDLQPTAEQVEAFARKCSLWMTESEIHDVQMLPTAVPLEVKVDEQGNELGDFLTAPDEESPVVTAEDAEGLVGFLEERLWNGDPKYRYGPQMLGILRLRSGIALGHILTLKETGFEYRETRERIRQKEEQAKALILKKYGDDALQRLQQLLGQEE